MKISILRTGLSRILCLEIALTAFAASSAIAQQGANGTEQQSIVPLRPMAADAHPSFEVATIKPANPNELKGNFFIGGHRIVIETRASTVLCPLLTRFIKSRLWMAQPGLTLGGTTSLGKQTWKA